MNPDVFIITLVSEDGDICFPCRKDQFITTASEEAGYRLLSCASGYCGACRARLISGRFESTHAFPPDQLLLCQVTPDSDLILKPRLSWQVLPGNKHSLKN